MCSTTAESSKAAVPELALELEEKGYEWIREKHLVLPEA